MAMRRMAPLGIGLVFVAFALAGCASEVPDDEASEPDPCPVAYPDGSPFDCEDYDVTTAESSERPSVADGWSCVGHVNVDAENLYELWTHDDGRAGVYWEWPASEPAAVKFVQGAWYSDASNVSVVAEYTQQGFVEFPEPNPAEAAARIAFHEFLLDMDTGDGWRPVDDARLAVGRYQGEAWFVWTFEGPQGPETLSVMQAQSDPPPAYEPDDVEDRTSDRSVYSTHKGRSFVWESTTFEGEPQNVLTCQSDV